MTTVSIVIRCAGVSIATHTYCISYTKLATSHKFASPAGKAMTHALSLAFAFLVALSAATACLASEEDDLMTTEQRSWLVAAGQEEVDKDGDGKRPAGMYT